jgi:FixJ family two-component response regulator
VLQARHSSLTPREREVFALVASGMLNKLIADRLGTAEATIKIHRGRVMEKMEANSVADLVRMAQALAPVAGHER